jgi:hypothetical protein
VYSFGVLFWIYSNHLLNPIIMNFYGKYVVIKIQPSVQRQQELSDICVRGDWRTLRVWWMLECSSPVQTHMYTTYFRMQFAGTYHKSKSYPQLILNLVTYKCKG